MKCKTCNGTGSINNIQCPSCEGFGQISEQTNEEWFNGLATEEKAKRIINIAVNSDCDYRTIVEWLKQPHRNKEQINE